ncbi:MAG: c-type cytochrome, partial [Candidatus Binatia bacterium]
RYPWPYQLAIVESVSFEAKYPRTLPKTAPRESAAWAGFAIFRDECFSCHSINGEGGKIGPELNVPRSIVEYRPKPQLREFIRDPGSFRHTSMPSHQHLSERQLDELIAYFDTMKTLKQDER